MRRGHRHTHNPQAVLEHYQAQLSQLAELKLSDPLEISAARRIRKELLKNIQQERRLVAKARKQDAEYSIWHRLKGTGQ